MLESPLGALDFPSIGIAGAPQLDTHMRTQVRRAFVWFSKEMETSQRTRKSIQRYMRAT